MAGINESSEHVSVGASELASASLVLAEGAEEQAASIEQLAATTNTVAEQVENSRREAQASATATAEAALIIEISINSLVLLAACELSSASFPISSATTANPFPASTAEAALIIEQNQEKMKQMMEAMNNIHETSQQVVGIIQTIEDIACEAGGAFLNTQCDQRDSNGEDQNQSDNHCD